MKIPLINTNLEIKFNLNVSRKPKIEKLKKELSDFFDNNKVLGINIREFDVKTREDNPYLGVIFPKIGRLKFGAPGLDYSEEPQKIGGKYNLKRLRFSLDCYGK